MEHIFKPIHHGVEVLGYGGRIGINPSYNSQSAVVTLSVSVTRYGDLLDFGQLFKAFGNI